MAKRKAMDLRNTLVWYNLFQTVFSAWIFYEVNEYIFTYIWKYFVRLVLYIEVLYLYLNFMKFQGST